MNPKQRTNEAPRSLVVTKMQRKCHFHIKDNATTSGDSDKGSTRVNKRGNQFRRRLLVGSLLKNPSKSKGKKNEPNNGDSGDGNECHTTRKSPSRELFGNNLVCGDQKPVVATLSKLVTLEEAFEPEGVACEEGKNKKIHKDKKGVRMKHPLLSFLDEKKRGWHNFIKANARKNNGFRGDHQVNVDGVVTSSGQVRRRRRNAGLWRLVRIPSRILVVRLKLKTINSLMKKKKGTKQCEHEDNGVTELCKKRILMGARCKPLSSPGTLRYDNHGVHLPEIVP